MSEPLQYWVLMWRNGKDWGWLRSLDGNQECSTEEPHRRLRYGTKVAATAALWKFRRDNPAQKGERITLVRVRAATRKTMFLILRRDDAVAHYPIGHYPSRTEAEARKNEMTEPSDWRVIEVVPGP